MARVIHAEPYLPRPISHDASNRADPMAVADPDLHLKYAAVIDVSRRAVGAYLGHIWPDGYLALRLYDDYVAGNHIDARWCPYVISSCDRDLDVSYSGLRLDG